MGLGQRYWKTGRKTALPPLWESSNNAGSSLSRICINTLNFVSGIFSCINDTMIIAMTTFFLGQKATDTSNPPHCPRAQNSHTTKFVTHPVLSALHKTLPALTVTALVRDRERHARVVEASFTDARGGHHRHRGMLRRSRTAFGDPHGTAVEACGDGQQAARYRRTRAGAYDLEGDGCCRLHARPTGGVPTLRQDTRAPSLTAGLIIQGPS